MKRKHKSSLVTRSGHINMNRVVIKKVIKTSKRFNRLYSSVSSPISFYELTSEDFPDIIPYHTVIEGGLRTIPDFDAIATFYNHFSQNKDFIESLSSIIYNLNKATTGTYYSNKRRSILILKIHSFIYKMLLFIILPCFGIHKSHEHIVCFFDYLNFLLSSIYE